MQTIDNRIIFIFFRYLVNIILCLLTTIMNYNILTRNDYIDLTLTLTLIFHIFEVVATQYDINVWFPASPSSSGPSRLPLKI